MSKLRPGMHDHPGVFPTLPACDPGDITIESFSPNEDDPFRTAWEYKLTHSLSISEGAAFWTAANLVHAAMRDLLAEAKADALREAADGLNREALGFQPSWGSNPGDQQTLGALAKAVDWLRDRAANPYRETTTGGRDD